MASIDKIKKHFEDFVDATEDARSAAEKRRDYRDLKQWTGEEKQKLSARDQAAIVFDQFSKKVDAITGLEVQRRTDPKALPVHPKDEKAAEVITDGLRFVESKSFLDESATDVFEDKLVEGYGGVITEVERKGEEFVISPKRIPWDRIYFDPHSREKDFSDSSYFGITLWMDLEDAIALNEEKRDEIESAFHEAEFSDETFEDRPKYWINTERKRIRVNQEFYLHKGVWHEVFYSGDIEVIESKPSPYEDEDGEPMCPIELECDFVDRENARWGYMERLIDVQDEINHRRSKGLHMLSSKTVIAERGAFGNTPIEKVLQQFRKGFTFIEKLKGTEVEIDNQQDLGQSQLAFYQDAQNAMDSVGINPELSGSTDTAISGRAFIARQQGGMVELARIFSNHSAWKRRVYRQIWLRMRQFWTEEKWVRVTDNENALRFVGINVPITMVEKQLEESAGMDINKIRERNPDAVDAFIKQEIQANPALGQVVEKRNDVKQLEMDIILEEVPDTAIIQQEQFEMLANLAGTRGDPQMFEALLSLSNMPNKDAVLEKFKPDEQAQQQQAQAQQQVMEMETADKMADIAKKQAEAQKTVAEIPLVEAQTKDELASAVERVGKTSTMGLQ
ncbi:hypothetical protein KAR91_82970 [Candidatus Pacearchaeota archaeon]|nr:hypothetical protein [Candidatus Pacearchaeota archaeon]